MMAALGAMGSTSCRPRLTRVLFRSRHILPQQPHLSFQAQILLPPCPYNERACQGEELHTYGRPAAPQSSDLTGEHHHCLKLAESGCLIRQNWILPHGHTLKA
ncbi:hypothetical protein ACQJBY_069232 [Aegilops geniculata]